MQLTCNNVAEYDTAVYSRTFIFEHKIAAGRPTYTSRADFTSQGAKSITKSLYGCLPLIE